MIIPKNLKKMADSLNIEKIHQKFPYIYDRVKILEKIQNHKYNNIKLAVLALIHKSVLVYWPKQKDVKSNERLEFFGDAYLSYYIGVKTLTLRPDLDEGWLSKLRAYIVGTKNLYKKAEDLKLNESLLILNNNVAERETARKNIMADLFESVTASLLIDGGYKITNKWLDTIFINEISLDKYQIDISDVKTKLQAIIQSIIPEVPRYKLLKNIKKDGKDYFVMGCFIKDNKISYAAGFSKQNASKKAAEKALNLIQNNEITKKDILNFNLKNI